jgi:hypothetical protein
VGSRPSEARQSPSPPILERLQSAAALVVWTVSGEDKLRPAARRGFNARNFRDVAAFCRHRIAVKSAAADAVPYFQDKMGTSRYCVVP